MSSHREAPQISKDPTADSTDVYAFLSPDAAATGTVTLIANYVPLQAPGGGPNFYEFGDDVLYAINVDNDGDGKVDISYQFRFTTVNNIPNSFLYNDGPIGPLTPPGTSGTNWNRQQTFALSRVDYPKSGAAETTELGTGLLVPPCNIGPLSTPDYAATYLPATGTSAVQTFSAGGFTGTVFAGQRAEGFYVDLGAVFDLGDLRPFAGDHEGASMAGLMNGMPGVNSTAAVNVHSLALQIPIGQLTSSGTIPVTTTDAAAVLGVWTTAARRRVRIEDGKKGTGDPSFSGPWTQVSRLGNPLVNELLIGIGDKDYWNSESPVADGSYFFKYFANPLLGILLPDLYPGVFPNLATYNSANDGTTAANAARPDIVAILLSGIPNSVSSQVGAPPTNVGGAGVADHLRLNVAQPLTAPGMENIYGYLGGDPGGFPNGRRVYDDVATIELRAVAGATIPLVDSSYKADGAASAVDFGLSSSGTDKTAMGTENYLSSFPYLGTPYSGYATPSATPPASTG